jgi:hypothetical protein
MNTRTAEKKEIGREYAKKYYKKNRDEILKRRKKSGSYKRSRVKQRIGLLVHYGGERPSCACCGEDHYEFLCIDHINGGGTRHIKERGNPNIGQWIRKNNYPDGFRVLCHNCNMALGLYGYCPHEHGGINMGAWK